MGIHSTMHIRTETVTTYAMNGTRPRFLQASPLERLFNRLFGLLVGLGIGLRHNYLLQVQGRKSGRTYSTPVDVLNYQGKRFLVAPRGETQWVRNARASGQVWLKKALRRQAYSLRAVGDHDKPEILREYLSRFKLTVQRYFPVEADARLEAFSEIASQYPVFELIPR
jgi:deazaflavin-dependent oxidoreductase (nitroreductase family)